jgi:hypothetical protein
MGGTNWRQVPVGLDTGQWVTRAGCKTVLVAVHSVTTGQRLAQILPLFESDRRVQVVFTAAPDVFSNGVTGLLRRLGGVAIGWEQATRTTFDLALAAGYEAVHELHAPLIVVPHGAGRNKLLVRREVGAVAAPGVYGLHSQNLVRGGRVVPAAIVLSHRADLVTLRRQCPEALPVAEVTGDPCYDQLVVSKPLRAAYRRAIGLPDGTRLVATASSWGTQSLFGQHADLHERMLTELPRSRYAVAALMHPNVWYGHGPRQVRAWLGSAMRDGLMLVPPTAPWLSIMLAADIVVGDAGSSTAYAAAAGVPVMLAAYPSQDVAPGSAAALVAQAAPRLCPDRPIDPQLADAMADDQTELSESVAARITSEPGQFRRNMRRLIYRVLGLTQPTSIPVTPSAGMPTVIRRPACTGQGELSWRGLWSWAWLAFTSPQG